MKFLPFISRKIALVLVGALPLNAQLQETAPLQIPDPEAGLGRASAGDGGDTAATLQIPDPVAGFDRGMAREMLLPNWSDADVFGLRAFSEPLVAQPTAASAEENAAFFSAINAFLLKGEPESLEGFLRVWPASRWAAALNHNLGLIRYNTGYFTAAREYWKKAWELARPSRDPRMRALAYQSVAHLAKMHARLGRIEELKPLMESVNKREAGGSARQMLDSSAEALHTMQTRPAQSFKCGPFALGEVRKALGTPDPCTSGPRH